MVISYPIPPYSNPPIQPQFYKPKKFVISNITLGTQTLITTILDMDYVIGQQVRLIIPSPFGCYQLNGLKAYVISIPNLNEVLLDLDSSQNVNSFVASLTKNLPQILAIGDINSGVTNISGRINQQTFIDGSFINISPN